LPKFPRAVVAVGIIPSGLTTVHPATANRMRAKLCADQQSSRT
jgi:hypothetical protein